MTSLSTRSRSAPDSYTIHGKSTVSPGAGDVTGVAQTYLGSTICGGKWEIDGDNEGEFEIEIEYADREIEIEAEFKGRRSYWNRDWEEEND